MQTIRIIAIIAAAVMLSSCAKVGSEAWCDQLGKKDKGDWTANEAADYAKYCVMGIKNDD